MKWLGKILSALARPLGISSPEDIRNRPSPKTGRKQPVRVVPVTRPLESEAPKNPLPFPKNTATTPGFCY